MGKISLALQCFCLTLIRAYRWCLSPMVGWRCRFYPSCSAYALEALQQHGLVRGIGLTLRRLLRCQPFCQGGLDPVPGVQRKENEF